MDRFTIEEVENMNSNGERWIACKLYDTKKEYSFWIDCSLIDGYGNSMDAVDNMQYLSEYVYYNCVDDLGSYLKFYIEEVL